MDANSKKKVPGNTITRDIRTLAAPTGNIYESVVILYKRANQIAAAEKKELTKKLEDFRNDHATSAPAARWCRCWTTSSPTSRTGSTSR